MNRSLAGARGALSSMGILSGWRFRAMLWSVLLAAVGYLAFFLWGGWPDVLSAISKVGAIGIAVTLILSLLNYGLRFIRWQAYLQAMGQMVPTWPSLKIYLAGFALTTTPGKAGEAMRGVVLKRWGVPHASSFAAFLSERLSDLLAVVLLTLFGLAAYPAARPLILVGAGGVLGALMVISSRRLLRGLHQRIRGARPVSVLLRNLLETLLQAQRCQTPLLMTVSTVLSLAAWTAEAFAFYLILHWMGLQVALSFALFVYAIAMLAGALSFMPGGLGGAEAMMAGLLIWKGAGSSEAIAATVLIRLTTLWFAVAIGATCLLFSDTGPDVGPQAPRVRE